MTYEQSWNDENRLASVTNRTTGLTTTSACDGNGDLVRQETRCGTWLYVGDLYELF